jgi:hypothetical protein
VTGWITQKAVAAVGSVGVGLLSMASFWSPFKPAPIRPVKMLFTYPITYLEPTLYDDWETVFIGNHIYPRLLPDENNPAVPSLTNEVTVACSEPVGPDVGPNCRRLRISFSPKPFTDCKGRRYEVDDLRKEFESLLTAKSWAVPGWHRCANTPNTVCVTGKNTGDVGRRLQNVNFRFGWSKHRKEDTVFGAGPYCLTAAPAADGSIKSGVLDPRDGGARFPRIEFSVGGGKNADFDISLYGSNDLLKGPRKNVQAHTPLAFYVVTNPSLAGRRLPWNTEKTRTLIREHFIPRDVFYSRAPEIERLVPAGAALAGKATSGPAHSSAKFMIPDYLPGCRSLAAALTASWSDVGEAKAECGDIVTYIQGHVREKRGGWSGFLVGLSPGDAGRDAIKLQYFSKDSTDSLTYDYPNPDALYYLAGIGQSMVTVDGQRVCELKPNALGLGNIFITDLVGCDR